MAETIDFEPGGFRFVKGVPQYSCAVAALPGFRLERVRFANVIPLAEGFRRAGAIMAAAGRPPTAFAACELRSPEPFTEAGFKAFNGVYQQTLGAWGLLDSGLNPVARSNVCPEIGRPPEPGFYAFSFTVPAAEAPPSFVIAGSGEAEEGHANYRDHIVAYRDLSPKGLQAKMRFVLGEMERRMGALGFDWSAVTGAQVYTVHDFHAFLADEIVGRGATRGGLTWHYARPPVQDLDYEMDCRGLSVERVVAA